MTIHRAAAERLLTTTDRATGALLDDGTELLADQVVLAAGSLTGRLAGVPPEVVAPVRPVKGQVLRLTVPATYAPFLSRTVRAVVRGSHVYLVPRENGELVIGATSEELGWDTTVTAGGVYELLRDAHELVPGITELPLTETRAGLRPGSPDNAPLLGPTELPGLHLATGHYRNGVLLTPLTGEVLAELLATGELPEIARPFTPAGSPPHVRSRTHDHLRQRRTARGRGRRHPRHGGRHPDHRPLRRRRRTQRDRGPARAVAGHRRGRRRPGRDPDRGTGG